VFIIYRADKMLSCFQRMKTRRGFSQRKSRLSPIHNLLFFISSKKHEAMIAGILSSSHFLKHGEILK